MKKRRERRSIPEKLISAAHFWYEAHDAIQDAWKLKLLVDQGRDPAALEVPGTMTKKPGSDPMSGEQRIGFRPSDWDMCAIRVKDARRFLGALQSHCRALARAGYRKEAAERQRRASEPN